MTRKNTAKSLMLTFLKEQGIEARRSKVGINFDYEGWNFLFWHDAEDPMFFRLTLPGIFDVTDENYAQALMVCNSINWNFKVVKTSLYEFEEDGKQRASVWVCYERQLDESDVFGKQVFMAMKALIAAAEQFEKEMGI